jgi:DNA-binding response OmpR family regulator
MDNPQDQPTDAAAGRGRTPRILVVDADAALQGLLGEWLVGHGEVRTQRSDTAAKDGPRCDLVIVDVAFPRQGEAGPLRWLADAHPGTPVLALSSTFFAGIDSHGALARSLGVAGVLPKPVARQALVAAVQHLLAAPA